MKFAKVFASALLLCLSTQLPSKAETKAQVKEQMVPVFCDMIVKLDMLDAQKASYKAGSNEHKYFSDFGTISKEYRADFILNYNSGKPVNCNPYVAKAKADMNALVKGGFTPPRIQQFVDGPSNKLVSLAKAYKTAK
jgi:hypothetical protein